MICEQCHQRQASIILTHIVNGNKIENHLCDVCAKEQENKLYNSNHSFQQFLSGLMKLSEGNKSKTDHTLTCPKCHLTFDEFRKTSKFGCDRCYDTFEPYIRQILKSVQGTFQHTGKEPKRLSMADAIKHQREELESKLRIALMQEDYLEAAKLRDTLNSIREDLE